MDKKLFFGAFILLILEALWLLADMNMIYIHGISKETAHATRKQIGTVEERRHTLKRRYLDSIVWEDTNTNDPLYFLDSVLTLDQSSATLRLMGDTQLSLSENTLVVLEPSTNDKTDQLRVRFSRGDMKSRNPDRNLAVEAATWTVEVQKGSEVSLRTKDSENLELEVRKGKVLVKEENQTTATQFETGDVVKMNPTEVIHQKIDESINWITPIDNLSLLRKYSHHFPVLVELKWQGQATFLNWEDPAGKPKQIVLQESQQSHDIFLEKGLHHFRLVRGGNTSVVLPVEVWKAPEIHTFWPLPRDRYETGKEISYSWSNLEGIQSYQLNITNGGPPVVSKRIENQNSANEVFGTEGSYEWSVEAFDSLGFLVPYYYKSPIYFLKNPLAPPVLEKPELMQKDEPLRAPAGKKPGSAFLLFHLLISPAHAKEKPNYKALFKWQKVEGAYQYNIEIDDEPNFKTPLVQQKTNKPEFMWDNFKLNTYYWRVAAEGKNGEMGLFSPVTTVDLTNPKVFTPPPNNEEASVTVATKRPPIKKKEPPSGPIDSPPLETQKVAVPPPVAPSAQEQKEELIIPSGASRPINGYVLWTPLYEYSIGTGTQNFKTLFAGMHVFAVDSRFDFPIDQKFKDLTLKLNYRESQFKAFPETEYPFQAKLKRANLRANVYYGDNRNLRLGVRTSTYQNIKRKSFEQLEMEEWLAYGPSILWPVTSRSEFEASALMGTQAWLIEAQYRYNFQSLIGESLGLRYGAELETKFMKTNTYQELELLPKLFFGLSW